MVPWSTWFPPFSANLIVGTIDPMLAGLSTEAAKMIDPNYVVSPTSNMFFMFVSTFLITALGWFITDKIVEPRLSKGSLETEVANDDSLKNLSDKEKKALIELFFKDVYTFNDNKALDIKQRKNNMFDFDADIQLNLKAKIGDKINYDFNYNTKASFDFEWCFLLFKENSAW